MEKKALLVIMLGLIAVVMFTATYSVAYESLITSNDMTGINTDVGTVATGLVAISLTILGVALIMKVLIH